MYRMIVAVDEPGKNDFVAVAKDPLGAITLIDRGCLIHSHNALATYCHCAIADQPALRIHRYDDAGADYQIDRLHHATLFSACAASLARSTVVAWWSTVIAA